MMIRPIFLGHILQRNARDFDTINIKSSKQTLIFLPNAFTPTRQAEWVFRPIPVGVTIDFSGSITVGANWYLVPMKPIKAGMEPLVASRRIQEPMFGWFEELISPGK
jgi:hypothetical protein